MELVDVEVLVLLDGGGGGGGAWLVAFCKSFWTVVKSDWAADRFPDWRSCPRVVSASAMELVLLSVLVVVLSALLVPALVLLSVLVVVLSALLVPALVLLGEKLDKSVVSVV
jgi:hypothetical protein